MIPASRLRRSWRMMPDRVTVTYRTRTALPGTYADVSVTDCWWRPVALGEGGPSDGVYLAGRRTWYLPKEVKGGSPMPGDLVVNPVNAPIDPASYSWTALSVSDAGGLGTWAVECVSLQLAAGLRGSLTFTRPSNAQDAAGRMSLASYSAVATNVPARVQPDDGQAADVLDRRTLPRRYTAVLGYAVDVRAKDLATDDAGSKYTVLACRNPERLDELPAVELERIP